MGGMGMVLPGLHGGWRTACAPRDGGNWGCQGFVIGRGDPRQGSRSHRAGVVMIHVCWGGARKKREVTEGREAPLAESAPEQ